MAGRGEHRVADVSMDYLYAEVVNQMVGPACRMALPLFLLHGRSNTVHVRENTIWRGCGNYAW